MVATKSNGKLVIISGPSGAGKSTVVDLLLKNCKLPLKLSVSATTRPPRESEVDGEAYHFIDEPSFTQLREQDAFLEYKDVFASGYWYGTLRETVTTGLNHGLWVILEIDIQGAFSVLNSIPDATTIFIHAGSIEELERRLTHRGTDSPESINRRLQVARDEMSISEKYMHQITNSDPMQAMSDICSILEKVGD
ncbi:MAG: guanylate kinase [Planctomycetaceae bacterium]|jgi:guanylate kinase|nr:guanylate kinase [Planctomycetaceae bacterium]